MNLSREPTAKPDAYYGTPRVDLLEWMAGVRPQNVLEVGCGAGANAAWLREHGAIRIVGIDPDLGSSQLAAERLDEIHTRTVESALPEIDGPFDLVICADVLEHLLDPALVLRGLRDLVAPSGALLVSVPNIRYFRALGRIAVGAGFRPETSGTFDSTHIRFFTRRNLRDLLQDSGWLAERWGYPRSTYLGHVRSALGRASLGLTDEWLAAEWYVQAHPIAHFHSMAAERPSSKWLAE